MRSNRLRATYSTTTLSAESAKSLSKNYDVAAIVEYPGIEQAMQSSVATSKLTKISFTTLPAVAVEDFDKLMAEI